MTPDRHRQALRRSAGLFVAVCLMTCLPMQLTSAQDWQTAISSGDYARARVALESALAERPDDIALRYQLARVLGFSGLNEEALAEYESLLSRFPDDADYLLGQAQMLGRLGQTEEALRVTERALGLAPDYEDLWRLRLQLADRSGDADLAGSLRADMALRYPEATWWQRTPEPLQYSRWLSVGWELQQLSNGAPDWARQFVRVDMSQSSYASWFGEVARAERFNRNDLAINLGGEWQALPSWRVGGALSKVSNAAFLPDSEVSVSASRSWQAAWGTAFQLRRREYATTAVTSYQVTGDKYFSDYRVAYGLNYSRLDGAGGSLGQTVAFGWYPTENRSLSISFGAGEEVETVGLNQLLRTRVRSVTLSGRQAVTSRATLSWWLGTHRQGDFYRRSYAGISARVGF